MLVKLSYNSQAYTAVRIMSFYKWRSTITSQDARNVSDPCHHGTVCPPVEITDQVFAITMCISIIGSCGNFLSIIVILCSRLRKVTTSGIIVQLNCVDFLYCSTVLPLQAMQYHKRTHVIGLTLCQNLALLRFWLSGSDMFLISTIALYRVLQVVYNRIFLIVSQTNWFLVWCLLCYIVPAVFVSLPLTHKSDGYVFETRIIQCTLGRSTGKDWKSLFRLIGYLLPAVTVLGSYLRIAIFVYRQGGALEKEHKHRHIRMQRTKRRIYVLVGLTALTFLLGFTPLAMTNFLDPHMEHPEYHLYTFMMLCSSYMLNPVVYSLTDGKFQRASVRVFNRARGSQKVSATRMSS